MLIGIMGKTGSGKSTITKVLNKDNKFYVIDVDQVNHRLLENSKLKEEIIRKYPIIVENGKINRKKLAMILYNDKEKMEEYNNLVWLYLEKELDHIIETTNKPIIIDWMMLPLTKYYDICNIRILIDSSLETRLERIKKRDNINDDHFIAREKNGLDYCKKDMDFIINNDKGIDEDEIKSIRKRITLLQGKI